MPRHHPLENNRYKSFFPDSYIVNWTGPSTRVVNDGPCDPLTPAKLLSCRDLRPHACLYEDDDTTYSARSSEAMRTTYGRDGPDRGTYRDTDCSRTDHSAGSDRSDIRSSQCDRSESRRLSWYHRLSHDEQSCSQHDEELFSSLVDGDDVPSSVNYHSTSRLKPNHQWGRGRPQTPPQKPCWQGKKSKNIQSKSYGHRLFSKKSRE